MSNVDDISTREGMDYEEGVKLVKVKLILCKMLSKNIEFKR